MTNITGDSEWDIKPCGSCPWTFTKEKPIVAASLLVYQKHELLARMLETLAETSVFLPYAGRGREYTNSTMVFTVRPNVREACPDRFWGRFGEEVTETYDSLLELPLKIEFNVC
jgi:hypothetical protein